MKQSSNLVLCVDDELVGLQVRKILLERAGYRVLTAKDGPSVLELFNAHPIEACEGSGVTAVHNGIIENYVQLRTRLLEQGHEFHTDTDSEVISHLVEQHYDGDLVEAVRLAYNELHGHFAFAVVHRDHPNEILAARRQCPLVVGVGAVGLAVALNLAQPPRFK